MNLEIYRGKVLLVVNVASKCGFTPQYKGLQKLYDEYKAQDFEVLGFPCNQFGNQEPGTASEISSFCELNFGVNFPLFSKIEVNGPNADPLFSWLQNEKKGFLGIAAIKWNFTKFLVDKNGAVIKRYGPNVAPKQIRLDIEKLLG